MALTALVLALAAGASGAAGAARAASPRPAVGAGVSRGALLAADNFIVRVGKSERQKAIDAWEIGDAWRPGVPNRWTKQAKDLTELHTQVVEPITSSTPTSTGPPPYASTAAKDGPFRVVPLVGAMMRTLTLADLALELSSPEPPALKALRQADVRALPMSEAINGVPEEVGRMLTALCLAVGAKRVLDIGTFSGYSALSAALGMPEGGKVTCCEPNPRYAAMARDSFGLAPTRAELELLEVDGDSLIRLVTDRGEAGTFDLVFVDADPPGYDRYFEAAHALLRPGGLLILHDTLWSEDRNLSFGDHPRQRALNARIAADRRWSTLLMPFSFGLTFSIKTIDWAGSSPPPAPPAIRGSGAGACDPSVPLQLEDRSAYLSGCDAYIDWLRARRAAVTAELAAL
jgi:predicted O-methyltransferase YrrM